MHPDELRRWYSGDFEGSEEAERKIYEEGAQAPVNLVDEVILDYFEKGDLRKVVALYRELDLDEEERQKVYEEIAKDAKERMETSLESGSLENFYHHTAHGIGLISYLGGDPEEYGLEEFFDEKKSWLLLEKIKEKKKKMDEGFPGTDDEEFIKEEKAEIETMLDLLKDDKFFSKYLDNIEEGLEDI